MSGPLPDEVDVVVVGAGGAGMCAALAAARQGLDVVLVEKSGYFGGSTARSGGGVWMPGNAALKQAGAGSPPRNGPGQVFLDSVVRGQGAQLRPDTHPGPGPPGLGLI